MPPWLPRLLQAVPFRIVLALLCLLVHVQLVAASGRLRFNVPFNAAPERTPAFARPNTDHAAHDWNRLVVSRWDAGSYVGLALRGYEHCPAGFPDGNLRPHMQTCNLVFYPTYPWLGRLASLGGRIPVDYALFAISLVCGGIFLFLLTGPALVSRLGLGATYATFAAFNAFTSGFSLVTVQTEPLALVLTLGAFVSLADRRLFLGVVLAGAATAVRVTALATGVAYGAALIALTLSEWPLRGRALARRLGEMVTAGWGIIALMIIFGIRFGDPFVYKRAHSQSFGHTPSIAALLPPNVDQIALALDHPLHEGLWLAAALLWFGLGYKEAFSRFTVPERVFCFALFVLCVGVAAYGTVDLAFAGMTRYLLLALPLFFAMGAVLSRRPFALVLWLAMTSWHYWNIDVCEYTGGPGNQTLEQCHARHWIGRI